MIFKTKKTNALLVLFSLLASFLGTGVADDGDNNNSQNVESALEHIVKAQEKLAAVDSNDNNLMFLVDEAELMLQEVVKTVQDAHIILGGTSSGYWQLMAQGDGNLLGMFPTSDGNIILVDSTTVRKINNQDLSVMATYNFTREITAADCDGDYIAIADRAIIFGLDATSSNLQETSRQYLRETCGSGVMLSDHMFVCGPNDNNGRIFEVYDLVSGTKHSTSIGYSYRGGIPMRRVPGHPAFLTTDSSDFHLFNANDGEVTYVVESPRREDYSVSNEYAFYGNPASHIVTHEGIIVRIFGPDNNNNDDDECESSGDCLIRDGVLGVFADGSSYIRITQDNGGSHIYGLLEGDDDEYRYGRSMCEEGCILHKVNVVEREVKRATNMPYSYDDILLAYDPAENSVLLGGKLPDEEKYEVRKLAL